MRRLCSRRQFGKKMASIVVALAVVFSANPTIAFADGLPTSYSSVDKGYVTSIKNQNPWGACWTFSAVACMESYAISHGYATSSLDLSEYALAELTFNDQGFESQTGDYTVMNSGLSFADCLESGGNYSVAFKALNKWAGIYQEYEAPYDNNSADGATWYDMSGKTPTFYLTGMTLLNMSDLSAVKTAIMNNGAVSANCNSSSSYEISRDGYSAYYLYNYENYTYNHAITLVGWDDSIPATYFSVNGHTPSVNGGWLVKNSWGTSYGKGGYQWISYEDVALLASTGVVYEVTPSSTYDYNYQHDGATQMSGATLESESFANVFTVPSTVSSHRIEAVAFAIHADYRNYSIQIYQMGGYGSNPYDGVALLSTPVTGTTGREGYYTVKLPTSLTLVAGTTFAVVVTFDQKTAIWCSTGSWSVGSASTTVCTRMDGQSYYGNSTSLRGYNKTKYNSNFCLKAFATDPSLDGYRTSKEIVPSKTIDPVITTDINNSSNGSSSNGSSSNGSSSAGSSSTGTSAGGSSQGQSSSQTSESCSETEEDKIEILVGDVNQDGVVDLSDMMNLKSHIMMGTELDEQALKAADTDQDGDVDVGDYILLRSHLLNSK